ncbi:ubiquinone biosynthesis protein UbiB [Candidatus Pelagibacter sp.]|uniref:ubiquinone biosynthesis protein UbiB n=1 Tax=Candidatus Pelagibacter sp. TaxID=2024849 RepID=UPI003F857A7B
MIIGIIGQNLTSLVLANALVKIGLRVELIVDKKTKNYPKSRTLGISKSNEDFISKNICNINNFSWKIKKIKIFENNNLNKELIKFQNNDYLFSILKNHQLYDNLIKKLKDNSKFKEKKIFDSKKYNLIINTDSTHSLTRKFFSKKIKKNYYSNAYTTVIKHKKIVNDQAIQVFTKNGPIAFLPISNNETSLVYSYNGKIKLSKTKFIELINRYNTKFNIIKFNEVNFFPLKSSNLRSYYYKNILAFGDILHQIHPLAGQGFNMTIRDIKILLKIIKNKVELGLPIDQSVNADFEKKTKSKNYLFSKGIDMIYEFFNLQGKLNSKFINQTILYMGKNRNLNKAFKMIADTGSLF